ncbi:MAG: glycosyltransferase family 2 protein [Lamprobacter sp.]|uniref:glycosyltransferase family 2 protein n=1 Tax=Lamprobacter sp. TaxID=3100796 RepID=UPI002B25A418|nr:glycosyltransferase family 2 protein [Lamprobacter sp.]MEA3639818.1 glycosyltransferase family 2 protein [Lamprobacter sp.]
MSTQAHKVAVLIPYYQRRAGILSNTVRSVLAQQGFDDYQIIVVDDGAPVPARDELKDLKGDQERIRIIEQPNAGPGAARNTALANLPAETDYVAFLDSDDELQPSYLADAVHALDLGYDLFFGNSQRADIDGSRFDWRSGPGATLETADHRLIDSERELYAFQGDFFDFVVYRSNIIGPSTMMYRQAIAPDIRYNEQVYNGQDRIFKLKLCQQVGPVAFSTKRYAQEGKGINIFDSAGWGSERSLSFTVSYIEMCKVVLKEVPLNERQRAHVKDHLARTRYTFTANLLHQARQRAGIDWKVVAKTVRYDPGTLMSFIPNVTKIVLHKAKLA